MTEVFRKTFGVAPRPEPALDSAYLPQVTSAEQAYSVAIALNEECRPEEAILMLQTALFLDDGHTAATIELGATLCDVGRGHEAVVMYEEFLESRPDDSQVRLNFGGCLLRQGELARAITEYQRCIEQRPSWEAPFMPLINALIRLQRIDEAKDAFEAFNRLSPDPRAVKALERLIDRSGQ